MEVKASSTVSQKAISQLLEFRQSNPKAPCYVVYLGVPSKGPHNIYLIPPYLLGRFAKME